MEWIIFAALCFSCYGLHKLIMFFLITIKGFNLSETKQYIVGWALALLIFGSYWLYVDSTAIKDGNKYYVNLFPEKDSQKNYRVPGLIYAEDDGYHLSEVYWSNGGSLNFEFDDHLIIGEKVLLVDEEGEDWYVELTNDKVKPQ